MIRYRDPDYCVGGPDCETTYPHAYSLCDPFAGQSPLGVTEFWTGRPDTGEPSTARLPQEPTPQLADRFGSGSQQASAPLPLGRLR